MRRYFSIAQPAPCRTRTRLTADYDGWRSGGGGAAAALPVADLALALSAAVHGAGPVVGGGAAAEAGVGAALALASIAVGRAGAAADAWATGGTTRHHGGTGCAAVKAAACGTHGAVHMAGAVRMHVSTRYRGSGVVSHCRGGSRRFDRGPKT